MEMSGMKAVTLLSIALVAAGFLAAGAAVEAPTSPPDFPSRVVGHLEHADVDSILMTLYYPPHYSESELETEYSGLGHGLEFLLERLGPPGAIETCSQPPLHYDIALLSGDPQYWESRAASRFDTLWYTCEFPEFGPGVVALRLIDSDGSPEVWSLTLGLPAFIPHARDTAIEIYTALARHQMEALGMTPPPNLRETVKASVPKLSPSEEGQPSGPAN
jgi:hypothetical protein